ncbi:hypothetical protein BRC78_01940 [Halobacteriales archaeon QH_8_68_33]|nr:MAG: hypothetical protein BRC78_01940 [Halobacteriales archaeon QH_8_68_33]
MQWIVRFKLPNGGAGPETVASGDLAAEYDAIAVLLLRDHYCQVSRDRASLVAGLPDSEDRADYWRERYDLDFPVLADAADATPDAEEAAAGSGASAPAAIADGTPRFDAFADIELAADSPPAVGVLDTSSKFPRLVHAEGGDTIQDCPSPAEALDAVTDAIE